MVRFGLLVALIWGCGSSSEDRFEVPGLFDPPCELEATFYVVDSIQFPATFGATELGLDLDRDGRADNQLGISRLQLDMLIEDSPVDLDAALAAALEDRDPIWVIELQRCADRDDDHLRVHSRRGLQLVGDLETGAVVELEDHDSFPAVGACDSVRCVAEFGAGVVPLSSFADSRAAKFPAVWLEGIGLAADLELDAGMIRGRLGIGLDHAEAFDAALEPVARTLDDVVQSDQGCPDACETEAGQTVTGTFDQDRDQRITAAEVLENRIFLDLLVNPDVDLFADVDGERVYWPGRDGVRDRTSLAVGLTAREVAVDEP